MCKEVYDTLVEWTGKGMIALKELRAITGRLHRGWQASSPGWTTSVFYAVITDAMHDIETGQELKRAKGRDGDQRPKVGLVAVKRLGAALNWLIAMLDTNGFKLQARIMWLKEKPAEWGIISDASPMGLGAILWKKDAETGRIQIIEAYEAPFTPEEAQWLKVDHGQLSWQCARRTPSCER